MTETDEYLSIEESLDFDIECSYNLCEKTADWICRTMCCNIVRFHCNFHKEKFVAGVEEVITRVLVPVCPKCNAVLFSHEAYYSYEKL